MAIFKWVSILLISYLAASSSGKSPQIDVSRIDCHGAVLEIVTPLTIGKPEKILDCDVSMSTHPVELGMNLTTVSALMLRKSESGSLFIQMPPSKENQKGKKTVNKKHALIMLVCCLIPIAGLAAVSAFNNSVSSVVYTAMLWFCPLAYF